MNDNVCNDIFEKYSNDMEKYEQLEEELTKTLEEIDNIKDKFCNKYENSKKLTSKENKVFSKLSEIKLEDIRKKYNNKILFRDYIISYFCACIAIRQEMTSEKNKFLFYSYMFNLTHFLELNIKALGFFQVKEFNEKEIGHWILEMYTNNKDKIINLGVEEKYYNLFIELLTNLRNLVNKSDIAMCFKYPVDKDFLTPTITDSIRDISFDEILEIIKEHKIIMLIALDIYIIGQTSNLKKSLMMLNENKEELKNLINKI